MTEMRIQHLERGSNDASEVTSMSIPTDNAGPEPNFYLADPAFEARMRRQLGRDYAWCEPHLVRMGALAGGPVDRLAFEADAHPPELVRFDREGRRIDDVRFHPSYEAMRELAYGAGIVALAYDDAARPAALGGGRAPHALVFALGYVFGQAEAGLFCPICMTDGAARVIERFAPPAVAKRVVPRLAARDRRLLWEGAMWLTEKQGGSDVGANTTEAREGPATGGKSEDARGGWRLFGDKWFCSNAGAEVMLVLARPRGAPGGTDGLGLFLVLRHREDGSPNAIRFHRLKNKLGTRSMPTGEATLEGADAELIAPPGRGFKAMAEMLNMSRLYNAVASCAAMRRATWEAASYARKRTAFGRTLDRHPLQREAIADLAVDCEAATALTFEAIRRLDRLDAGSPGSPHGGEVAEADKKLLRALTPLAKLATARAAVAAASEACEALGGNGYIEEFVTPRLLRDAQVLPIWEGTTNILALDLFARGFARERAHETLRDEAERMLADVRTPALAEAAGLARESLAAIAAEADRALAAGDERPARELALRAAEAFAGALLVAEADGPRGELVALRHASRRLASRAPSGVRPGPAIDELGYERIVWNAP
jgi:alkylation response protein AidB-like acyl-CoA dehydrogenase